MIHFTKEAEVIYEVECYTSSEQFVGLTQPFTIHQNVSKSIRISTYVGTLTNRKEQLVFEV